jgi:hypothetical protein
MARKRASGAGRKPKGEFAGKSATITTRIRPDTRAALEAAADASKRSLSQEVEYRLRRSLDKPAKAQRRNQALAYLITLLAEEIEKGTGKSWLDDPFTSLALQYAIGHVALHFAATAEGDIANPAPIGEAAAKMPPEFAERFRKPEGFGGLKAYNLIHEVQQAARPPRVPSEWDMPIFFTAPDAVLADIGRDLGLSPQKRKI